MTYLGEFRANWRTLLAATVGMGFGFILYLYIGTLFAPHLIREFGWSKSQYALLSSTFLISLISLPIFGRLTDRYGARRIGMVGIISYPLIFVAFGVFNGGFALFFLLNMILVILVGATTTSALYSRIIADMFDRSRGFALSLIASAAPASAAIAAPLLSRFMDVHGWRAGYFALAGVTAIAGTLALLLMPRAPRRAVDSLAVAEVPRDYRAILRSPSFRIILAAIFLCCLASLAVPTQLKLILLDRGLGSDRASLLVSFFAIGIVVGRLGSGVALDRFAPQIVSAITLGLPSIGLFVLASGLTQPALLAGAVSLIGFAMGAELAIATYLVMRWFRVEVYSSVYGLIAAGTALSGVGGSLLLSLTLKLTGAFDLFLYISAAAMAAGAAGFLLLGRHPTVN